MMEICALKDVGFNGSVLRAAQDFDGIVWVGVAWVCAGLGFSKSTRDYQIQKIQHDAVLREGCLKFQAGVFDDNNETLALQLDYMPLWLCKINITDNMRRAYPELAERLKTYQLWAKDILAAAFLGNRTRSAHDIDKQVEQIQRRVDEIYTGMANLTRYLLSKEQKIVVEESPKSLPAKNMVEPVPDSDWKKRVNGLCQKVVDSHQEFVNKRGVLRHIYGEMNRNYGVVWDQEKREWKRSHPCPQRVRTLQIVEDNEQLRSIFQAMLEDLAQCELDSDVCSMEKTKGVSMIQKLIEVSNDKSVHGNATFRRVYRRMENEYGICWETYLKRYKNKTARVPRKVELIEAYPKLEKAFNEIVRDMLENES